LRAGEAALFDATAIGVLSALLVALVLCLFLTWLLARVGSSDSSRLSSSSPSSSLPSSSSSSPPPFSSSSSHFRERLVLFDALLPLLRLLIFSLVPEFFPAWARTLLILLTTLPKK
jgi:hypothetical protein